MFQCINMVDDSNNNYNKADKYIRAYIDEMVKSGWSYDEIFCKLHKMIDIAFYEHEVDEIL